jgi:hypothetical protein
MALDVSLVFHPVWPRLVDYLTIEECPRDGGSVDDPRIRIGFDNLPEPLGHELAFITMQCVHCLQPIHPLRRRAGDLYTRLYYACACPVAQRPACSKSRAAALEYQRFKGLRVNMSRTLQLSLF